jgi:hypothetical protein
VDSWTSQLWKDIFVFLGKDFISFGEPLSIGKAVAVIDDGSGEASQVGDLAQALRNMTGAENDGARGRNYRLHEDVELAAADEAVIIGRVLAEVEAHVLRFLSFHDISRRVPDFGLDASAADGADHRTVLSNQ